jgi:hypothetical protein
MKWQKDISQAGYYFQRDKYDNVYIVQACGGGGGFNLYSPGTDYWITEKEWDVKGYEFLGPITPEMAEEWEPGRIYMVSDTKQKEDEHDSLHDIDDLIENLSNNLTPDQIERLINALQSRGNQ